MGRTATSWLQLFHFSPQKYCNSGKIQILSFWHYTMDSEGGARRHSPDIILRLADVHPFILGEHAVNTERLVVQDLGAGERQEAELGAISVLCAPVAVFSVILAAPHHPRRRLTASHALEPHRAVS